MILSHKQGAVMILQYTSQYLSRVFCFESKWQCRMYYTSFLSFRMAQQPNSGLGHITVEVSRSHTIRHTYSRENSFEWVISSSQ
jgi:hypothetical protein